jgi:hypothetical protein
LYFKAKGTVFLKGKPAHAPPNPSKGEVRHGATNKTIPFATGKQRLKWESSRKSATDVWNGPPQNWTSP